MRKLLLFYDDDAASGTSVAGSHHADNSTRTAEDRPVRYGIGRVRIPERNRRRDCPAFT